MRAANIFEDAYWDIASIYDVWGRLIESKAHKKALEFASIRDSEDILEVAVGTGMFFKETLKLNPKGNNYGL